MTLVDRTLGKLLLVALAVIVIPWVATYVTAFLIAKTTAPQTIDTRLAVVGDGIVSDLDAYIGTGIPLDRAVDVSDYLTESLHADSDIRAALVATPDGKVVGRFIRPGGGGPALPSDLGPNADWERYRLNATILPIEQGNRAAGQLVLAYDTALLDNDTRTMTKTFLLVLAIAIILGFELVLLGFRETVLLPLATMMTLEKRAAGRGFDRIAALPATGPLTAPLESLNKLVVAVNDRYLRIRAHLQEIQELSFNPNASGVVASLRRRLEESAQFAPEGMGELAIDRGPLIAGPAAFRAGIAIGVAAATVLAASPAGTVEAIPGTIGLFGLAALLAGRVPLRRRFLPVAALLAVVGLLLLPALPWPQALLAAALAAGGAMAVSRAIAGTGPAAMVSRFLHGTAGIVVGTGIVLVAGQNLLAELSAVLALAALSARAVRFAPSRANPNAARNWSVDGWRRLDAGLTLGAVWLLVIGCTQWSAEMLLAAGPTPVAELMFGGAGIAVGMAAALLLPRVAPGRLGAEAGLAAAALLLAVLVPLTAAASGPLGLLAAIVAGFALAAGGLVTVRGGRAVTALFGSALVIGAGLAAYGKAGELAAGFCLLAALGMGLAAAMRRLQARRADGDRPS